MSYLQKQQSQEQQTSRQQSQEQQPQKQQAKKQLAHRQPSTQSPIPWSTIWLTDAEAAGVAQSFETTWLSMGPKVKAFEERMAAMVGAKYALAISNGTVALELSFQAMGIGPGDTVAVPAFTYFATISSVVKVGATPLFIDSAPGSFNMCAKDLADKVDSNTKAVVYIDYAGLPADYAAIEKVARDANLVIVHDAAQSPGTTRDGQSIVRDGDISTTSFHAAKLMTTVEGGMVFCNDEESYRQVQMLRNQGEAPGEKYVHRAFGTNARMTDMQAAIGLQQLSRLPSIVGKRRALANRYGQLFDGCDGVEVQRVEDFEGFELAWMLYPILVENRDAVAQDLKAEGIDTRIAYARPTHRQPCVQAKYSDLRVSSPRADYICDRVLNLPMFHEMTEAQQARVSEAVKRSVQKHRS